MDFDSPEWQTPPATRPRRPSRKLRPPVPVVVPLVIVVALALLGVLAGLGLVLFLEGQPVPVTVIISGDARPVLTRAGTVAELMGDLGVELTDQDLLVPPADAPLAAEMVIRLEKARRVALNVDGETRIYWTSLTNPADILASAGEIAGERDLILIDGTQTEADDLAAWPVPATEITLRHAARIHIADNGATTTLYTTSKTVGEALFEAGVTLYLADTVSPDTSAPVTEDLHIDIFRSRPISIIADGATVQTRTQGKTVADALADAGVALVGLDYSIPGEDTALRPGLHIRVIRVREEIIEEEATLPFETLYQADSNTELDQSSLLQQGQEGLQRTQLRVRYENGIEIRRTTESTEVVREARDHIIGYGTKVVIRSVDTPDGPREYWRVIRLYATSYHPAALGGDNITATGRVLQKGIVGVDRDLIPFGTELYVPGYGVGLAADTGPDRRTTRWIDLGYTDEDWEHWARNVEVYILTPVPEQIDYILPG